MGCSSSISTDVRNLDINKCTQSPDSYEIRKNVISSISQARVSKITATGKTHSQEEAQSLKLVKKDIISPKRLDSLSLKDSKHQTVIQDDSQKSVLSILRKQIDFKSKLIEVLLSSGQNVKETTKKPSPFKINRNSCSMPRIFKRDKI